jgi:hypothetical protein
MAGGIAKTSNVPKKSLPPSLLPSFSPSLSLCTWGPRSAGLWASRAVRTGPWLRRYPGRCCCRGEAHHPSHDPWQTDKKLRWLFNVGRSITWWKWRPPHHRGALYTNVMILYDISIVLNTIFMLWCDTKKHLPIYPYSDEVHHPSHNQDNNADRPLTRFYTTSVSYKET